METHHPDVNISVAFQIPQDNVFVSGQIVVTDHKGEEINTYTMNGGDLGMVEYIHVVRAMHNNIGSEPMALRSVSIQLVDDQDIKYINEVRYYLAGANKLIKGNNSLITYVEALMIVPTLTELNGWYAADEQQHVSALVESYNTLSRFILNDTYVHDDITAYSLTELLDIETTNLFRDFTKAQVLHANYLLGGEPEKMQRDRGIMSNSAGESTTFFRTSKPLDYGISSRAYMYIGRYLDHSVVIRNA